MQKKASPPPCGGLAFFSAVHLAGEFLEERLIGLGLLLLLDVEGLVLVLPGVAGVDAERAQLLAALFLDRRLNLQGNRYSGRFFML